MIRQVEGSVCIYSTGVHDLHILRDLVILAAVAIPVVAVTQKLRVPSVVGFLLTGLVIGPHALGWIADTDQVDGLAEIGVLLLLFTIGLELSLSRVMLMRRMLLQGGLLQVVGTIAVVAVFFVVAADVPTPQAVFYGSLVALSSTAIVLRVYGDRGTLDTPHGRVAIAILLCQDICIVPLMLLTPVLAGAQTGLATTLTGVAMSVAVLAVLVGAGRFVVPWVLEYVVGVRNRELFTLTVVLFVLGAAFLTASFGLSLALGAFLAGLIISESPYGLQALTDVLPFRDTFSGIFFISVGMLLDIGYVADHALIVFAAVATVIVLKTLITAGATRSLRRPIETSLMAGLGLAQVGEFSFVMASVGAPLGLLSANSYQLFLATSVVTMLIAPLAIAVAPPAARLLCKILRRRLIDMPPHEKKEIAGLEDHVIIVGYGLNGRNLARVLAAAGVPFVILEQNGMNVREARRQNIPVYFGDGTQREVLEHVGVDRARVVVFAISSPAAERRGVATARHLSPNVQIVVRTRYIAAVGDLQRFGANEVVPEEFETSIEIFSKVLRMYGVPGNVIEREVAAVRGEAYEMFRGLALPDLKLDALSHLGVHSALDTVQIEEGARAVGENPVTLSLRRDTGATVIAVVRDSVAMYTRDPDSRFEIDDTVVLVGDREALEKALPLFRAPRT